MNEHLSEDERRKREEREKKKAEVRARLEAAAASRKKKGGFITPERKKKLRLLLRRKAAEELKREQEVKANERRRVIGERVGQARPLENLNEEPDQVAQIIKQYHERLGRLEDEKFELEYNVRVKDYEIAETTSRVCDMRGKFVKPPLKKTPKYEAKIERMILNARKEIGFTVALKSVKKDQFAEATKDCKRTEPEWSWKNRDGAGASGEVGCSVSISGASLLEGQDSAGGGGVGGHLGANLAAASHSPSLSPSPTSSSYDD